MIIDMEEHAKHRQELRDEINLLKDKIYEFKKYLDEEADEYAKSMSSINIEASVIDDVIDKFNEIFTIFDY